jgi:hypothetical protein
MMTVVTNVYLSRSSNPRKKYMVKVKNKTVHFGAKGMSDYTIHKDLERKQRYIDRHRANEDWTKSGIDTAGFWSRWLLWSEPTLRESIQKIENKFGVKIVRRLRF